VTLRTLDSLDENLEASRVFVRADLNVPLRDAAVADDARIAATVPTLEELLGRGAQLVIASHLGRPKGEVREDLRLAPVAAALADILGRPVTALDVVTPDTLPDDDLVLLENLRFDPGEEANDIAFAGRLAELADVYVDDAFGAVHRAHASVSALPELLLASGRSAVAGRLLEREVSVLGRLLADPDRPYVAILGGAKISDKLGVVEALIGRVDELVIGGAMVFTFVAAAGGSVGRSLVEDDRIEDVRAAVELARQRGVAIHLPVDVVAASAMEPDAATLIVPADEIPADLMGLDIGPDSVTRFREVIAGAKTVLWNGPMGVFEMEPFAAGTRGIAQACAESSAFTVLGGGDSVAAVRQAGLEASFDHLSTGGGASLEFLEGCALPGITILEDHTR
jgi:phosphoglycerate kinase